MFSTSATPAATQALTSKPSTGAPKNTRNSCISSGVPWKSWMKAVARRCGTGRSEVRASATISPPSGATDEGDE